MQAFRQLHDPARLAVSLRIGASVVPPFAVFQMTSFQRNDGDGFAIECANPGDDRWIVAGRAIAVKLDELAQHAFDVVHAGETPGAARALYGIPGGNLRSVSG